MTHFVEQYDFDYALKDGESLRFARMPVWRDVGVAMSHDQHVMPFGIRRWMSTKSGAPPRRRARSLFEKVNHLFVDDWEWRPRIVNSLRSLGQIVRSDNTGTRRLRWYCPAAHLEKVRSGVVEVSLQCGLDTSDFRVGLLAKDPYMIVVRDAVRFPDTDKTAAAPSHAQLSSRPRCVTSGRHKPRRRKPQHRSKAIPLNREP